MLFEVVDIAFEHHMVLYLWKKTSIVLLPKDTYSNHIHRFQNITLIESDLQWLITFVWGKRLNQKFHDEQTLQDNPFARKVTKGV